MYFSCFKFIKKTDMSPPILTPTLLLDKAKCLKNIKAMAEKAHRNNVLFRPHFKTHQAHEVGRWFREFGVKAITVSSLTMAEYFAADDWKDITVAFPVNILEIERINQLAKAIQLNLVIESIETLNFLKQHLSHSVAVFLKIDAGYHRTGILVDDTIYIQLLLENMQNAKNLEFAGFLAHSGHSYEARSQAAVLKIHQESKAKLSQLKNHFIKDYPDLILSVGDTPTCSVAEDFAFANEIRPGNFVFYDVTQNLIESCDLTDISVALACPVVALHPIRKEIVVYGGGVHLSKDRTDFRDSNQAFYGYLAVFNANKKDSWNILPKENHVKSLSQEHGIIKASDALLKSTKIGDILLILPIHSCMTADLMRQYQCLNGKIIPAGKY
ncbi:MAG: D-serine deaminase-like pyridoxal phosphate-dependent protein [Paraglaciecola sp.]